MANQEHVKWLQQGVAAWNEWREKFPGVWPDLRGINLSHADLSSANLSHSNLHFAKLNDANLRGANLIEANLSSSYLGNTNLTSAIISHAELISADFINANLSYADLIDANLTNANLNLVNLSHSKLTGAKLTGANLTSADLTNITIGSIFFTDGMQPTIARFVATTFAWVDLCSVEGLDTMIHSGPSIVDVNTVKLPQGKTRLHFLRGAGFSDAFIDYLPALLAAAIRYASCFISYAHQDEALARRLYKDLQDKGVRCWFTPEDMKIGDHYHQRIDESIHLYEKLVLILSEHAVQSAWVEREVVAAREKEDREQRPVLFPIRLDDAVMDTTKAWAADVRRRWHIGDFTQWKQPDAYQQAFERLLRDLKSGEKT